MWAGGHLRSLYRQRPIPAGRHFGDENDLGKDYNCHHWERRGWVVLTSLLSGEVRVCRSRWRNDRGECELRLWGEQPFEFLQNLAEPALMLCVCVAIFVLSPKLFAPRK